jgi:large subunit ribosomal protein L25
MDTIKLNVLERTETGNGPARRLRVAGLIPGTVYGKGTVATSVSVELEGLREAMTHGHNVVLELDFAESDKPAKKAAKGQGVPVPSGAPEPPARGSP